VLDGVQFDKGADDTNPEYRPGGVADPNVVDRLSLNPSRIGMV
jgi:hypothetical protein